MNKPLIIQYSDHIIDWYLDFILKHEDDKQAPAYKKIDKMFYAVIAANILGTVIAGIIVVRRLRRP